MKYTRRKSSLIGGIGYTEKWEVEGYGFFVEVKHNRTITKLMRTPYFLN